MTTDARRVQREANTDDPALRCGDETHLRTAVVSDVHTTRDQRHDNSRCVAFFSLLSSYIVDFVILRFLTTPPQVCAPYIAPADASDFEPGDD